MMIDERLRNFIEQEVFPIYATFDKGHDVNHITAVIDRAMELYDYLNDSSININILYASAALHDIGMMVERENHYFHSEEFVLGCDKLKEIFNDEEIVIIGQAVCDHSTSRGVEPRSIYGKMVSDADKDNDLEVSLLRAYEFSRKFFPNYTEEECIEDVYEHLVSKYGEEGKVKFWINSDKQKEFKRMMQEFASNKELFYETIYGILEKNNN